MRHDVMDIDYTQPRLTITFTDGSVGALNVPAVECPYDFLALVKRPAAPGLAAPDPG